MHDKILLSAFDDADTVASLAAALSALHLNLHVLRANGVPKQSIIARAVAKKTAVGLDVWTDEVRMRLGQLLVAWGKLEDVNA
jgi:hypothetical protein